MKRQLGCCAVVSTAFAVFFHQVAGLPEAERNTSAALMSDGASWDSVSALSGTSPNSSQRVAQATPVQVTGVRLNPTARGLEVVLETQSGIQPEVYLVNRDNDAIADLPNAQLALPGGNAFHQTQPFVGIESVTVAPLPERGVRVIIRGAGSAPTGQVVAEDPRGIVLSYAPTSLGDTTTPSVTVDPGNAATDLGQFPRDFPDPNGLRDVLVPEPDIFVDGAPVQGQQARPAPIQPRAIAPPVGDIAVSSSEITAPGLDLGTDALVPFLVLRDAPVRDVLELLARSANLDFVFTDGETPGAVPGASPTNNNLQLIITLNVRNKPVQEVFENVLRISGLEATRRGSTIFVAPRLNNAARNTTVRSLRLNQVTVDGALDFLAGMGAEVSVSEEQEVTTVTAVGLGDQNAATPANRISTTTQRQLSVRRVDYQNSIPPLRHLIAVGDQRTNSITLIGSPAEIQLASEQIARLDVRRRQVAVNVRVIDVSLAGVDRFTTSFSFGVDDTRVIQTGGVGLINFGTSTPATTTPQLDPINTFNDIVSSNSPEEFTFARRFLAQLQAVITSGNAKILTDPNLVVQEGQTATVQLTEDVITNFQVVTSGAGENFTQTIQLERTPAGLILQIQVDRIDDNGFVVLSVAPSISSPLTTQSFTVQGTDLQVTLLSERRVSSGQVRVRDGQTLILSGIIQDSDRTTVRKVPLLGDLPLLGALFRSTERSNERQEVIVLLTPRVIEDAQ